MQSRISSFESSEMLLHLICGHKNVLDSFIMFKGLLNIIPTLWSICLHNNNMSSDTVMDAGYNIYTIKYVIVDAETKADLYSVVCC